MNKIIEKLDINPKFEFKKELMIGSMKVDFNSGNLANSWSTSDLMNLFIFKYHADGLTEIQNVMNDIMFRLLDTYKKVVDECGGFEGHEYETNRYVSHGNCNYWIRLIPFMGGSNYYIKAYFKKEDLNIQSA